MSKELFHLPEDRYTPEDAIRNVIGESEEFNEVCAAKLKGKFSFNKGLSNGENIERLESFVTDAACEEAEAVEAEEKTFECFNKETGGSKCDKQCLPCKKGDYFLQETDIENFLLADKKAPVSQTLHPVGDRPKDEA